MERLYVLRNQLIHGGSTWNSGKNRDQVIDGRKFLKDFVPCLLEIMLKNPNEDWGDNNYPILRANKDGIEELVFKIWKILIFEMCDNDMKRKKNYC